MHCHRNPTGEVAVRTGDEAAHRDNHEVHFTDRRGNQLEAQRDGRIIQRNSDGSARETNEIVLTTGHSHPKDFAGGALNTVDRANERLDDDDRALSTVAPAIIKAPSGTIRVYVNGRLVR